MATTTSDRPASSDAVRTPSVLVVLVARDGDRWLRDCLASLGAQTHPRMGVVAVDNASSDGSRELLVQALGEGRVVALPEDQGLAGALRSAVELPAAQAADYLLILHDDVALAQDAVARMLEAAEGIRGVERVGVVGPKVVDWEDPRVLREVGRSTDRFGHPYTPLQDGERDQGQYDRVLEVLFVSSCAMLVSREAWQRTGPFDERYAGHYDDLDFCWRARLAGFRVLMTPLAQARHRAATQHGERREEHRRRSSRYYAERAALASTLKDYGVPTLLWLLPMYAGLGLARVAFLSVARRFEDAYDLLAAWGWNALHLPGTLRRRLRAQSVRGVRDRSVRRFMASSFRLPRWAERAEEILEEQLEEEGEETPRFHDRAASFTAAHPVLVACFVAILLGILAVRHFVGPDPLQGGALATFPLHPVDFFRELVSAVRTTGLGGAQPASPALAGLGALSWLSFGNPAFAEKLLLGALPPLSAILMYRALARQTGRPGAAVVGAASYGLSAVSLWAFSEGRIPMLVAVAVLPVILDRIDAAFSVEGPTVRMPRFVGGLAVATAVGVAFLPGIVLGVAPAFAVHVLGGRRRGRGIALAIASAAAAAALVFPVVPDIVADPGGAFASRVGSSDVWSILRLAPGGGPGTWVLAGFLPVAALLCFAVVGDRHRGRAWRALVAAVGGLGLAWASAAGYLPDPLANTPVYLAAAAAAEAVIVGLGLATLVAGIGQQAFGLRQLAAAVIMVVLSVGLGSQALQAALAEWEVGPNRLPPAWPVVAAGPPGDFRILWVGRPDGDRFPAPGGDPQGVVEAGRASVRFGLTDRDGVTALDTGRGAQGDGHDHLVRALSELLSGGASHGGALLGPFGIRFVVAEEGDFPEAAAERLAAQLDLDLVPAGGLVIYRNAAALPSAFVTASERFSKLARHDDLQQVATLIRPEAAPLSADDGAFRGPAAGGLAFVADQFDPAWRAGAGGSLVGPERAFGWAMTFPVGPGEVSVTYQRGWVRAAELLVLAALWLGALWVTRKPASA